MSITANMHRVDKSHAFDLPNLPNLAVGAIMSMIMLISFTAAVDIYIHTKAAELNESKYK